MNNYLIRNPFNIIINSNNKRCMIIYLLGLNLLQSNLPIDVCPTTWIYGNVRDQRRRGQHGLLLTKRLEINFKFIKISLLRLYGILNLNSITHEFLYQRILNTTKLRWLGRSRQYPIPARSFWCCCLKPFRGLNLWLDSQLYLRT